MKSMALWAGIGGVVGFILLFACFSIATRPDDGERGIWVVFSIMGAISVAALGALFAAVNVIQYEMREMRRELKHWPIQQMDIELDKPSTHIKPLPPAGRG